AAAAMNLEEARRRAVEAKVQDMQNVDGLREGRAPAAAVSPGYPLLQQTSGSMAVASKKTGRAGDLPGRTWPGRRCWRSTTPPASGWTPINNSDWARVRQPWPTRCGEKEPPDQTSSTPLRGAAVPTAEIFYRSRSRDGDGARGRLRTRRRVRLSELQQAERTSSPSEAGGHPGQAGGPQQGGDPADSEAIKRRKAKASTDLRLNDDK
uniref:CAC1F_C domain-containing protein n=1 Tax=Macrostomum lignano TaxID=282301 RepID=A0A1I8F5Y5_9PLAT